MTDYLIMALGLMVTMLGYFLHMLAQDIKDIRHEHNSCKNQLPLQFVLKDDFHSETRQLRTDLKEDIAEIKSLIGKLFDKVDGKN